MMKTRLTYSDTPVVRSRMNRSNGACVGDEQQRLIFEGAPSTLNGMVLSGSSQACDVPVELLVLVADLILDLAHNAFRELRVSWPRRSWS